MDVLDALDDLEKARAGLTLAPSKVDPTVRRWQNLQPDPKPQPDVLPAPEPGAVRLYRAARDEGAGWTTSFASERENAEAYLDNPGFGGPRLFAVDVAIDDDEVLDLRDRPPKWVTGYHDQDGDWIEGVDDGRSLDVLFADLPPYVEREVRARGIKWVRVLDTYPDSAETWIAVDDSALDGARWVELEKARRNLHREAEEAGQVSMFLPPDPALTLAPSKVDPTIRRWQNLQPDAEPEPDLPPAPPPDPDPFDADHLGVRDIFEGPTRMMSNDDARRLRDAYAKIAAYLYDRVGRFAEAKGKDAQIVRALQGPQLGNTFLRLSGFATGSGWGHDTVMGAALGDAFRADRAAVADAFKIRRPTDEGLYRKRDLSELGAALGAQFPVPTAVTVEVDRGRFGGDWGAGLVATWAPVNPGDRGEVMITVSGPTRAAALGELMDRVERDLWRTAAEQAIGGQVSPYPPRLNGEERLAPEFADDTPGAADRRRAGLEIARLHNEYQADLRAYDEAQRRSDIDRYRTFRSTIRSAIEGQKLRTDTVQKLVNDLRRLGLDAEIADDGPYWRRVYMRHPDAPSLRGEFSYRRSSETQGEDVLAAMREWLATEFTDEELLAEADKHRYATNTGIRPQQTRHVTTFGGLTLPWLGYDREVNAVREYLERDRRQEGLAKGSALSLGPAYADPSVRRWHNPGIQLVTSAGPHPDALQPVHGPSGFGPDIGAKPFAFWTSSARFRGGGKATSAWREGLRDAREGAYSWILEPQGDPDVLTIRTVKDYSAFMRRFGHGPDAADWRAVRAYGYDAVHYAPERPFKQGVFKDWRTESTAWFYPERDLRPMTKARLVIDLLELARRRNLYREAEEAGQVGLFDARPEPAAPPAGRGHLRLLPAKVDPTVRRWQDIRPEEVRTPPVSPELLRAVALHRPPPLVGGPVEVEDEPEPRPVWRPASEQDIPMGLAVQAFEGTSFSPEKRAESYRARYVHAVNEWAATYLARADKFEAEGNTEAADLIRRTLTQAKTAYRRAFLAYLSAHSRVTSWMITGPAGRNNAREAKRSDTADRRAQEADEILPAYSTYIARDLRKLAIEQAGGEVKYREALAARAARVRDAAAVREAMDRVVEAKAREEAQGTEGTFGPGGDAGVSGSWFVDEQGRLAIKFDERLPSNVYNEHMRGAWHYSRRTGNFTRKYTNAAVYDARKLTGDASIPSIDYRPAEEARKEVIAQRAEDRKVARGAARERSAADVPIEQDPDPKATLAAIMRKRSAFALAGGEKAKGTANDRYAAGFNLLADAVYRVTFEGRARVGQGAGVWAWESPDVAVAVWHRGNEPRIELRRTGYNNDTIRSAPIPPGSSMQDVGRLIASELAQVKAEDTFKPGSVKEYQRTPAK